MRHSSRILTSDDIFLAIDDTCWREKSGMSLCLCKAKKFTGNPIVGNEQNRPDEWRAQVLGVAYVKGQFQMWYLTHDAKGRWHTCYATSEDGYHWIKPSLGFFEYEGSTQNNIIEAANDISMTNVYVQEDAKSGQVHYIAPVYGEITPEYYLTEKDRKRYSCAPSHPCIKTFAYSEDGIHWAYDESIQFPIHKKIESGALFKKDDTCFMFHQMILGEYPQIPKASRYLGVSSSHDFKHWQMAEEPAFYFNLQDQYQHTLQTHVTPAILNYGNVVVGIEGIFYDHPELYEEETDLTLILSNDGYHWRQPLPEQPFSSILRGGDVGAWDHSFLVQGGIVNTAEKTLIYYTAGTHAGNLSYTHRQIGVAELPRDRFGYLTPSAGWAYQSSEPHRGELLTYPIQLKEDHLSLLLNAQGGVNTGDSLHVEVTDENGIALPGYAAEECDAILGEGLDIEVTWGRKPLSLKAGQTICLRLKLVGHTPTGAFLACTQFPKLFTMKFRKKV